MFHPLPEFRNPCWYESLSGPDPYNGHVDYCRYASTIKPCRELHEINRKKWEAGRRKRLRCLPHFYFAGVTKGGTSDMKFELAKHPEIVPPLLQELYWWNKFRQGKCSRN